MNSNYHISCNDNSLLYQLSHLYNKNSLSIFFTFSSSPKKLKLRIYGDFFFYETTLHTQMIQEIPAQTNNFVY